VLNRLCSAATRRALVFAIPVSNLSAAAVARFGRFPMWILARRRPVLEPVAYAEGRSAKHSGNSYTSGRSCVASSIYRLAESSGFLGLPVCLKALGESMWRGCPQPDFKAATH
jgi:hypothetical protein